VNTKLCRIIIPQLLQIDFMEEKLVENLTMLCEIINGEYLSISKATSGRYEVAKKMGSIQFSYVVYVSS